MSREMTSKLEELQFKATFLLHWIVIVVTSVVLIAVGTVVYWALEPDPLTVNPHGSHVSVCSEREFMFERYVHSSKPLDIYVQQRWYNLDGRGNFGKVEKETVIVQPDYYPLGKDFEKVMEFNKCVPDKIVKGTYEYRPWATYEVNPIKTIHRLLPVQKVEVVCDLDLSKHKSCDTSRVRK